MGIDMSQIRTATQTEAKLNARTAALAAAMIVAVFGAVFVYGIGFAGADVLAQRGARRPPRQQFPLPLRRQLVRASVRVTSFGIPK